MAAKLADAETFTTQAAQDVWALRRVFESTNAESCPTLYNFHMHTVCSDGQLQPEQLVHQAVEIGLKGFAITDHHSVNGYFAAQRWLNDWQQRSIDSVVVSVPHLWVGVEVTSFMLGTEVHILGYGFNPDHLAMQIYLQGQAPALGDAQADRVIASIHAAGGIAVLAHPVRYRRSPEELIPEAVRLGIDGVETYYAYNNPNPWQTSPLQTARVAELSHAYDLLNTCGTDTHGLSLLQRL